MENPLHLISTPIQHDFDIALHDATHVAGVGMSGGVMRCTRRADGEHFALKFLPMGSSSENELLVWRACTPHPHIVPLVAVYVTDALAAGHELLGGLLNTASHGMVAPRAPGRYYIAVMPLMAGGELFDFVAAAPVDEAVAATMMAQCTAAVAHVHACGFLHGDVKLENFLLCRPLAHRADAAGVCVALCDFGFARPYAVQPRPRGRQYTRSYISPEMIASVDADTAGRGLQPVGPSCDVWALGVAVHILLSRVMPFATQKGEYGWNDNVTITPALRRAVCEGRYPAVPAGRSGEAHAFVRELLCPLVALRATAAQAAAHAWLTMHAVVAPAPADDEAELLGLQSAASVLYSLGV